MSRNQDIAQHIQNHGRLIERLERELLGLDPGATARRAARRRYTILNDRERERRLELERERARRSEGILLPAMRAIADADQNSRNDDSSTPAFPPRRPGLMDIGDEVARANARQHNISHLRQAAAHLNNASSLLDEPLPPIATPSLTAQGNSIEDRGGRWRPKRRKLDSDDMREGIRGFSYGHYGQVVPGPLEMEIVSCDGGTYETHGENSMAENILLNDSSVYCTKSDRCNILLRHQGEAPFCLKKIVIKAPKSGYDSPLQKGMIFVSMTSDDLLARACKYRPIRERGSRERRPHARGYISQRYPYLTRPPLQSLERTSAPSPDPWSDSDNDLTAVPPSTTTTAGPSASDFRVTTSFDDKSEDDQSAEEDVAAADSSSSSESEDTSRGGHAEAEFLETDSDDYAGETQTALIRRRLMMRRRLREAMNSTEERERGRRQGPAAATVEPSSMFGHAPSSQQHVEALAPHAQFSFADQKKNMVSIKFDPPVSGRFILIRLWSRYGGPNIDIQSVVAHGFAGPRFFPSIELR
ncbi:hypothetical protein AJ80_07577 [Polytolypa hystricis UAMH7299]|uniref:Uncharacterized protein n=1 Tax=Polytolypa hystricis (strain UAMH7299) TaxID=1447883 RepID=A0A2B7XLU6_POLH7|nr:hypothetical protein AJ80_07577 [Polytolypa hystricis UAMH7299]